MTSCPYLVVGGDSGLARTITLKKPNGTTVTGTAPANAPGVATWSYTLAATDPVGTYSATSTAKVSNSLSYAINQLSLTVQ